MHNLNTTLFSFIYQGTGYWPLLDHAFVVLTSYITYGVVAIVLMHFVFYARTIHKKAFTELAVSVGLTAAIVWIMKIIIAEPRPFVVIANVFPLVSASAHQSFPSMHAAITMCLAIAVLPYHKHFGHLLLAFAFVVGLSRLYVGVHYPFDIGVGFLIGFVVAKGVYRAIGYTTTPFISPHL